MLSSIACNSFLMLFTSVEKDACPCRPPGRGGRVTCDCCTAGGGQHGRTDTERPARLPHPAADSRWPCRLPTSFQAMGSVLKRELVSSTESLFL